METCFYSFLSCHLSQSGCLKKMCNSLMFSSPGSLQVHCALGRLPAKANGGPRRPKENARLVSAFLNYSIPQLISTHSKVTTVKCFDKKKSGMYHISLNHQRQVKCKNVCKSNGAKRWCEKVRTHYIMKISMQNTGTLTFFEHHFQPLSTIFHWRIFFQTNRNRLVGATGAHFCQNSRSTNSPNFFFYRRRNALVHVIRIL